jgi:ATP-dependent Lon protease
MEEILEQPVQIPEELPLIPLRDLLVFPNLVVPLFVGRKRSITALEEAMQQHRMVALVTQRDAETADPKAGDLYRVGCVATVMQELKLPDGTAKALVEGVVRFKIVRFTQREPYLKARIEVVSEAEERDIESEAQMRTLVSDFEEASRLGKPIPQEVLMAASNVDEPGRLADFIAFHLNLKTEEKQAILEAFDAKKRLEKVGKYLRKELEILELGSKIQSRVRDQMTKSQREYFLREQLKAIQQELGGMDEQQAEIDELAGKIKEAKMPEVPEEKALKELSRLEKMAPGSAETSVIRTYLDWLIGLPWAVESEEKLDLKEAAKILDEDHYGLEKVKERVLEYLAVHKLTEKMRGPILCFVGPPGVGKTSIGRSIARSLGRKFIRVSLGGVRDEAEIRGHRRTYVGALPGRIIQSISQSGTRNPVFMLDEIDKVGADFRGDPTAALLEVLDPEQNDSFSDHYLEVPFDLSDTMFITTANLLDPIPPALKDRMEVIHFSGYTEEEKLHIAQDFLVPKQLGQHGLSAKNVVFEEPAIREIVREYTREAGVRNLERELASVCRQVARKVVEGRTRVFKLDRDNVHELLGPPQYSYGMAGEKDEIGVATGLAWTEVGGDVMAIEATIMKGKGSLILTGQLGEVMRESAQAAVSYLRANAETLGIDSEFAEKYDIHIHVPAAAIPKDGPSAGITMAISLLSALTVCPVSRAVAMTGEITLRGHVLPIGGLKEKTLAAHRAGIKKIIVPKENEKDMTLVPDLVKKDVEFHFVEDMSQVIPIAIPEYRACAPEAKPEAIREPKAAKPRKRKAAKV